MKKIIFLLYIALINCNVNGQIWHQTNGPTVNNTLDTRAFTSIGSIVFKGTTGSGVLESKDNGQNWTTTNSGITSLNISSLCCIGNRIFASSSGTGIFVSIDSGAHWSISNIGLTNLGVKVLLVKGNNIFAGTTGGIFLSTDSAQSWNPINTGLTTLSILSLATSGTSIYAGTNGGGAFITNNLGGNWTAINTGITELHIYSLVANGNTILAGTANGDIFITNNAGTNWSTCLSYGGFGNPINALYNNGFYILTGALNLGIRKSSDSGVTWTSANINLGPFYNAAPAVYALFRNGNFIYAGTNAGVWISNNDAQSWYPGNGNNFVYGTVTDLGVDYYGKIYAGESTKGLNSTVNGGANWINVNGINSLIRDIEAGSNLYIAKSDGVKKSIDGGYNFTAMNTGLTNTNVKCLLTYSYDVYAGTIGGGVFYWNGTTWTAINTGLVDLNINVIKEHGGFLYCSNSTGVYKKQIGAGGTWTLYTNWVATSLLFNNSEVYEGTNMGIRYSTDNGSTWSWAGGTGSSSFTSFTTTWFNGINTIFAGSSNGGIFISQNHGTTWSTYNFGLSNGSLQVNDLISNGSTVYAATNESVWKLNLTEITLPTISTTSCTTGNVMLSSTTANSYNWSNGLHTQNISVNTSGTYSLSVTNPFGFASGSVSISVSMVPLPIATVTALSSVSFCQGDSVLLSSDTSGAYYSSYLWNNGLTSQNISVNTTGDYTLTTTTIDGCHDTSQPIHIEVFPSSPVTTINQIACNNYTLNNQTYYSGGQYSQQLSNFMGCDSTVILNLSLQSNSSTIWPSSCGSYTLNGQTFNLSGTYSQTLSNVYGCDSLLTINLSINPTIDTTITQAGNTFISNEAGAIYQWLDCNNGFDTLQGYNSQSFIPTSNGNYAVMIVTLGCGTDTSVCVPFYSVITNENIYKDGIALYPNPTSDNITIVSGTLKIQSLRIVNVIGQIVYHSFIINNQSSIDVSTFSKGIYFIEAETEKGIFRKKFVKE